MIRPTRLAALLAVTPATTVLAQEKPSPPAVPNVATEIVIEDLAISVKRLRLGVALSPEQIDGLTKALQSAESGSDGPSDGSQGEASDGSDGGTGE